MEEDLGSSLISPGRQLLGWVSLLEQLLGDLTKVVDEADGGVSLERIVNAEDVHIALAEQNY